MNWLVRWLGTNVTDTVDTAPSRPGGWAVLRLIGRIVVTRIRSVP
jgi:hypothetical protein